MRSLIKRLEQTETLWTIFLIAIPLIFLSKWVVSHYGLSLLDGISDPDVARTLLSELSAEQNQGHLWYTTTLDVILPFAAAGLFASAALIFFGKYGFFLAIPPLFSIPLDLTEGVIQVLALTDTADMLEVKAYTTPVKSMGYSIGFLVSLAGMVKWCFIRLRAMISSRSSP